jgi:predicted nucleic acid-binding protein
VTVFSNTTPFIALSSIGQLELLPQLFGAVRVVPEVAEECRVGGLIVVPDLAGLPWIQIVPSSSDVSSLALLELDKGEKHTIHTACQHKADLVVIDEKIGRNVAEYLGLSVIGTLGVLLNAKRKGMIASFSHCVAEMQRNGLRYHPRLIERLKDECGE